MMSLAPQPGGQSTEASGGATSVVDLVAGDAVQPGQSLFTIGHALDLSPSHRKHFGDDVVDVVRRDPPQAVAVDRREVRVEGLAELRFICGGLLHGMRPFDAFWMVYVRILRNRTAECIRVRIGVCWT
jgi:hypothetical protein